MNPLLLLGQQGQSIWLDYISRDLLTSGELARLVREDGLRGLTSNPTIFEKAIAAGTDYDGAIRDATEADPRVSAEALFQTLAVEDIRRATDILRPVYDASEGADGFVSLEVSPHLAHDTAATVAEARRLWRAVDRPNLMIKVPATLEGFSAVEALIAEGINVNVTLIFSLAQYEAAAHAYIRGLTHRQDPRGVASVASFFVSRVDTLVDKKLGEIGTPEALALRGTAAIANARRAYGRFRQIFGDEPFTTLRRHGARVQRPLWGSSGTKNPAYSDVLYVDELIGSDTVNTVPPATLAAFRDHGRARPSLEEGVPGAQAALDRLAAVGIDLEAVTAQLLREGVKAFADSYDQLLAALEAKRKVLVPAR